MTKHRFFRYTLFILALICIDRIVGESISSLAKKQVRDDRIGLLNEQKIQADIFVLGSSRALNNYDPAVIANETGKSCYNLGVSGSNVIFHETMLDLVLNSNNKPVVIIYNLDDYGTLFPMEGIVYRKDVLYPFIDNELIQQSVNRQLKRNNLATTICNSYRQNVNFVNALKYLVYGREAADYKTTNIDSLGANLLVQRPEDPVPVFQDRDNEMSLKQPDPDLLKAFLGIQQKCLQHGIKLVLSLPPLFTSSSNIFKEQISKNTLPGVQLIDLSKEMQEAKYFFNVQHMNTVGAHVFSEKVGKEINTILN